MKLVTNYSQAVDQVRAGFYSAIVQRIDEHVSKKNTRCVKILFRITEGDFNGRTVPCIIPLEGKAAGFFRKFVQAIKPEYIDGEVDSADLLGKAVKIDVAQSARVEGERSYFKITVYPPDFVRSPAVTAVEQVDGGAQ